MNGGAALLIVRSGLSTRSIIADRNDQVRAAVPAKCAVLTRLDADEAGNIRLYNETDSEAAGITTSFAVGPLSAPLGTARLTAGNECQITVHANGGVGVASVQ